MSLNQVEVGLGFRNSH